MPKPDPALLDPARFRFSCDITTRFSDLDFNWHVNNVAMSDLLQEGRVRFHSACGWKPGLDGNAPMAASISVDFLGEARHPDPVTVHAALLDVGRTSHTLAELAMQGDAVIAFAQVVMVCVKDGAPIENPAEFVANAQSWMLRP